MRPVKNNGVETDFLMSFSGVLTMQHAMTLGSLSICLNSSCNYWSFI